MRQKQKRGMQTIDWTAQTFILERRTARVVTWRGNWTRQAEPGAEAGFVSFLNLWIFLIPSARRTDHHSGPTPTSHTRQGQFNASYSLGEVQVPLVPVLRRPTEQPKTPRLLVKWQEVQSPELGISLLSMSA